MPVVLGDKLHLGEICMMGVVGAGLGGSMRLGGGRGGGGGGRGGGGMEGGVSIVSEGAVAQLKGSSAW